MDAGIWPRWPISTKWRTVFSFGASFSTSGRKPESKHSTASSASLAIHSICSGNRRGLIVWQMRPEPDAP